MLEPTAQIPEGTVVDIEPIPPIESSVSIEDDPFYRLDELAVDTGVTDLAKNIDYYLYGHPKVDDAS